MVFVSDSVSAGKDLESQYRSRSRLGKASESRIRIGVTKACLVSVCNRYILQRPYDSLEFFMPELYSAFCFL